MTKTRAETPESALGVASPSLYNGKYLHQGGRFDATTGLYHFRNRDLSPTLGRWIQRDPIEYNAGDTNLYRYVHNGPTNAVDPSGLDESWLVRLGGGLRIVGGIIEVGVGAGLALLPDPTPTTHVLGAVLIFHGIDNVVTGGFEVATGRPHRTFTDQAVEWIAVNVFGASPTTGRIIGSAVDQTLSIAGTLGGGFLLHQMRRGAALGAQCAAQQAAAGRAPVNPHLAGRTPLAGTRGTGVSRARAAEVDLVQRTGAGTIEGGWTPAEIAEIRRTGELPRGVVGHHINNVAQHPEWAGDPRNIRFVRGQGGNLDQHGGNFQNPTTGPLIDR